jgi:glycosyltransferase involved in cell wall biosynthesis
VARLDTGFQDEFPNLRFRLPDEQASLLSCLQGCGVSEIEVHSLIGHGDSVVDLILALGAPVNLVIHDYSWFCPRISLTRGDHRYCGEPEIAACRDCVADSGSTFDEPVSPDQLVTRTRRLIEAARSIIAPSRDSARRIVRRFGREVVIGKWEHTRGFALQATSEAASQSRPVRICVVGAISHEKGYSNLLQCARLVATANMPIEFVVVGYTLDDRSLLDTDVVRITGPYTETQAVALIGEQEADFAWVPAVWPETWCYALTQIWEAGLYAVVHDIGAQAERVRATGGGVVVPLNIPLDRLLTLFLSAAFIRQGVPGPFPTTSSPNEKVAAL